MRVRKPMGGKIATGSLLIHDFERARGVLVRDGGLESEARRADDNDPVYLERLEMVNDLYSRLKHRPWRFTGFTAETLSVSRQVRLALPGQPGPGQMRLDRKSVAPYPDSPRDLPQLRAGAASHDI